jgi:hypothetical protein
MYTQWKTFYKANQQKVNVVAGIAMSVGALALTRKHINANTIQSCDYFARDDGSSVILVFLKDGATKAFQADAK